MTVRPRSWTVSSPPPQTASSMGLGATSSEETVLSLKSRELLVGFIADLRWTDLAEETRIMAKQCLLDTLGATLVGTKVGAAEIGARFAERVFPTGASTVIRSGRRIAPAGAAFANGLAANGTDIDDCGIYTWGHPGAQVFVACLALAEDLGLSGQAMLEATVIGYELAFRASRCVHHHTDVYRACGSWGSTACAGAASRLLSLRRESIPAALGIADYFSPYLPMMRDIEHPSMVKHGIGWGAMTGIMGAQLAADGFTSVPCILELHQYEDWVADLGQAFLLDHGVTWKEFSCCAWAHPSLAAARQLRTAYLDSSRGVTRIVVETYDEACRLTVRLPETTEEAQFSIAWPLAAMLVDGEVGPAQVAEDRLSDPLVRSVASKVELVPSSEFTRLHALIQAHDPAGADPAVVTIDFKDGSTVSSGRVDYPLVMPWSPSAIEGKFRRLTHGVLTDRCVDDLVQILWDLDDIDDASRITRTIERGWVESGS
jgi:2-methylcitrate dehydratase PrpD